MENLKDSLARSQARANLTTAVLLDQNAEIERLRAAIAQRESAVAEARARIERLEGLLETSRSAYDALLRSTSWRITAPLRRATILFRGKINSHEPSE
jgi:hypothetical protein